jgi:hypothetical protein
MGITLLKIHLRSRTAEGNIAMASERVLFWQKKLAENQRILELIDAGQFQGSDGQLHDEETTAEVRTWAARRVEEYVARIAEWSSRWA